MDRHKALAWSGKCKSQLKCSRPKPAPCAVFPFQLQRGAGKGMEAGGAARRLPPAAAGTVSPQQGHRAPGPAACPSQAPSSVCTKLLGRSARELPMSREARLCEGLGRPRPRTSASAAAAAQPCPGAWPLNYSHGGQLKIIKELFLFLMEFILICI